MTETSNVLSFNSLLNTCNRIRAQIDAGYKFRLPNHNEELDIRDYQFREAAGSYFLVRKEDPLWDPELTVNSMGRLDYGFPKFHPAHFIWLNGCTPEIALRFREVFHE